MKEALTKNLGLKLISLAVSILIWMIVITNENPVITKNYSNIPVTIVNSEIVTNMGNTYRVLNGSSVINVEVTGKTSVLSQITSSDIKAVADMVNLDVYSRMLVPIDITVPGFTITNAQADPENLQVQIEMETSKSFPISANYAGTPRDGYVVGELKVDPKQVEISGPESIVDSIAKVSAEVDVSGLSKDSVEPATITIYDHNGKVIDQTLIQHNLGEESVRVNVIMYETKTVPVRFDTSNVKAALGYVFEGLTIEPETIDIVGPKDKLKSFNVLEISSEALNEINLMKSVERTVDISSYLPTWSLQNAENSETAILVKIHVTRAGTKTIEYPTGAISLVNVPKGYKIDYNGVKNIDIIVRGPEEVLNNLELEKGSVSINLVNIKEAGTYTLPVQVTLDSDLVLDSEIQMRLKVEKMDVEKTKQKKTE